MYDSDNNYLLKLTHYLFFLLNAFRYNREHTTVIISIMRRRRKARIEMMMYSSEDSPK